MDRQTLVEMLLAMPGAKESTGVVTFEKSHAVSLHLGRGDALVVLKDVSELSMRDRFAQATAEDGRIFAVPFDEIRWVSAIPAKQARPGFG